MFPSETATSIEAFQKLVKESKRSDSNQGQQSGAADADIFHVILIDGTWSQASGIYYTNPQIMGLKQVIEFQLTGTEFKKNIELKKGQ